jgi:predicted permease
MADMTPRQLFLKKGVYKAAVLRLIVSPFLTLLLTIPFWSRFGVGAACNYEEYVYLAPIIAMAISPASSVVAMAEKFGGDKEAGAASFVTTTLLSVITIPIVICSVLSICGITV